MGKINLTVQGRGGEEAQVPIDPERSGSLLLRKVMVSTTQKASDRRSTDACCHPSHIKTDPVYSYHAEKNPLASPRIWRRRVRVQRFEWERRRP